MPFSAHPWEVEGFQSTPLIMLAQIRHTNGSLASATNQFDTATGIVWAPNGSETFNGVVDNTINLTLDELWRRRFTTDDGYNWKYTLPATAFPARGQYEAEFLFTKNSIEVLLQYRLQIAFRRTPIT